jgi:hypothetical protein
MENVLLTDHCLTDDHPCHGLASSCPVYTCDRLWVHRETMHRMLHLEILERPTMIGIVLMEHRDCSAATGHVNSAWAGVELDDIRPILILSLFIVAIDGSNTEDILKISLIRRKDNVSKDSEGTT